MGKRGPQPDLTAPGSKSLWRQSKKRKRVLDESGGLRCPSWLSAWAKAEWSRVVPGLEKAGLLAKADTTMLAMAFHYADEWRTLAKEEKPDAKLLETYAERYMKLAAVLGLSPKARDLLDCVSEPEKPTDGVISFARDRNAG